MKPFDILLAWSYYFSTLFKSYYLQDVFSSTHFLEENGANCNSSILGMAVVTTADC